MKWRGREWMGQTKLLNLSNTYVKGLYESKSRCIWDKHQNK